MPNVPRVPGVPNLASYALDAITLVLSDILFPSIALLGPQWGIFLDGVPALPINSVLSVDYRQDWTISDYQVEQGGFQSYDKVQLPFDIRVRVVSGGNIADRQAMIAEALAMANSLDLFDIVTPERVYVSVNCAHVDFNRKASTGLGMIVMDLWFTEIRETSTAAFSNTQQPGEAGAQGVGNVQPQTPPASLFAPNLTFF